MTVIVGVVKDGKVHMGGDSCGSTSWDWQHVGNPKVFRVGKMLIGCTTSFRMIDLLRFNLSIDKQYHDEPDEAFMRTTFVDNVINCFSVNGFLKKHDGQFEGGNFLIGYNGRLYEMQTDFSILDSPAIGSAVGSGEFAARGSLHTTRDWEDPEARIRAALEAAEAVVPSVRGPFTFLKED